MVAGRRFVRSASAATCRLVALIALAACRDEPTSATAPFTVEASLAVVPERTVGTIVTPSPTFVVRNANGDALANVPVTIRVTAGGGTLQDVPLRTESGATSVGRWTLDTIAGLNEITIVAGDAPPAKISLVGQADVPASVTADTGALSGFAGDFLSTPITLHVRDRYGNPVTGAGVELAVAKGGGQVSPPSLTTDQGGVASGISWQLGRLGGSQQIIASVGPIRVEIAASIRSSFDPVVRFHGTNVPPQLAEALSSAVDRLHAGIVGDASDVPVLNFDMSRCSIQGATLNETVDDLVIFALVTPIDGVGRVLASAGPCILRTQSRVPVIGVMRFDIDDIAALSENGRLAAVVLHEMLHVIGIGTVWRAKDMVINSGSQDPRFLGPLAAAQCTAAGGFAACADGRVPVENSGGSGTAEVHWRESIFDRELMTGFIEPDADMPLSAITVASLEDLGYTINLLSSDPFLVPPAGSVQPRLSPLLLPPWESLTLPLFEITTAGWVRTIQIR